MPTIVDILTFISRINTASESFKVRNIFIFQHFTFYEQLKFHAKWVGHKKSFITSGPDFIVRSFMENSICLKKVKMEKVNMELIFLVKSQKLQF